MKKHSLKTILKHKLGLKNKEDSRDQFVRLEKEQTNLNRRNTVKNTIKKRESVIGGTKRRSRKKSNKKRLSKKKKSSSKRKSTKRH